MTAPPDADRCADLAVRAKIVFEDLENGSQLGWTQRHARVMPHMAGCAMPKCLPPLTRM